MVPTSTKVSCFQVESGERQEEQRQGAGSYGFSGAVVKLNKLIYIVGKGNYLASIKHSIQHSNHYCLNFQNRATEGSRPFFLPWDENGKERTRAGRYSAKTLRNY